MCLRIAYMTAPRFCPAPGEKRDPKFLPKVFPLGVVVRFRAVFNEIITPISPPLQSPY